MSFNPSDHFNERWQSSPASLKNIVYQELDDIQKLLEPKTVLQDFCFATPDLHQTLYHMHAIHLESVKQKIKEQKQKHLEDILPILEKRLEQKMNALVMERLMGLDDELQIWLKAAIEEALEDI